MSVLWETPPLTGIDAGVPKKSKFKIASNMPDTLKKLRFKTKKTPIFEFIVD